MGTTKAMKKAETQQLNTFADMNTFAASTRLFGVYDRNGNVKVCIENLTMLLKKQQS